jgi:hypothetical protein
MTVRISLRVVALAVFASATVAAGLGACTGGDGASDVTRQPQDAGVATAETDGGAPEATEQLGDAQIALTATAEAEHTRSLREAAQIGEAREIHFYPEDTEGRELDATMPIRVTVTRFAKGSPPCGPGDEILSMCDGSVAPVHVEMQVDNPNDVPARTPQAMALRPDGEGLTLYVCPGFDEPGPGSELPPKTTATVTACFGSETPVSSLSGWSVRVSNLSSLPPDGSGEAIWIHD